MSIKAALLIAFALKGVVLSLGRRHDFIADTCEASNTTKRKLVIDTDPGIDDTAALLSVFGSGLFEVVALTTIFGNAEISRTTQNALNLLHVMGHPDVPVYRGGADPWSEPRLGFPVEIHGERGLGNVTLPDAERSPEKKSAADFIVHVCNAFPGEVSFLFDGPLTNLATALQIDPDLPSKWDTVAIMGGAFSVRGNVNDHAEANILGDPTAAEFVFKRGRNLRVVGLDVTMQCPFSPAIIDEIRHANPGGKMLAEMYDFYLQPYARLHPEMGGAPPHDAVALMALIAPELFEWKRGPVQVVVCGDLRGKTLVQNAPSDNRSANYVALSADYDAIVHRLVHYIKHPVNDSNC